MKQRWPRLLTLEALKCGQVIDPTAEIYIYIYICGCCTIHSCREQRGFSLHIWIFSELTRNSSSPSNPRRRHSIPDFRDLWRKQPNIASQSPKLLVCEHVASQPRLEMHIKTKKSNLGISSLSESPFEESSRRSICKLRPKESDIKEGVTDL